RDRRQRFLFFVDLPRRLPFLFVAARQERFLFLADLPGGSSPYSLGRQVARSLSSPCRRTSAQICNILPSRSVHHRYHHRSASSPQRLITATPLTAIVTRKAFFRSVSSRSVHHRIFFLPRSTVPPSPLSCCLTTAPSPPAPSSSSNGGAKLAADVFQRNPGSTPEFLTAHRHIICRCFYPFPVTVL
ncbi:unnamed protein product, partial [Musa acuminata subsp. burmannicoides]